MTQTFYQFSVENSNELQVSSEIKITFPSTVLLQAGSKPYINGSLSSYSIVGNAIQFSLANSLVVAPSLLKSTNITIISVLNPASIART